MLYNTQNFNTGGFNNLATSFASAESQDDFVFNNFSLSDGVNVITTARRIESMPSREFATSPAPKSHGEILTNDLFRRKRIVINGILKASTASAFDDLIDDFKKAMAVGQSNLDIKINGSIRRFVATLTNSDRIIRREGFHITFVPFTLEFSCIDPFGKDEGYTFLESFDSDLLAFTEQPINAGTVQTEFNYIIIFSAASSVTQIEIENTTTNQKITVAQSISAGDIFELDGENKTVKINSVEVDFSGQFIDLDTGNNSIVTTITGTSATYTRTMKHKNAYL